MTKRDIAIHVSEKTDITQVVVQKIIQNTLDYIVDTLAKGEAVELRNFGVFKVKDRSSRLGRNPLTGEEVSIPAKKAVVFRSGKIMKEKIV